VETRLKGYKYFEIERDFFNKLGVLVDGDFIFGVLLLVLVRFCPLSGDARIQGKEEKGTDIDSLQKKHFDIDCLYHRQGNEQKQVAVHQIRLIKETFCRSAVKFPSSLVKRLRRIGVETRLKGYKYFEIERDFFNNLGVLVDGNFKFGVLLLVFG
jgi:hypothetical protein